MLYNTAPTGLHVQKPITPTGWHYPTWSARAMSTNSINHSPERATLYSMVREGYENVREDYENTTTPQHSPERATLPSIARKGYEHIQHQPQP